MADISPEDFRLLQKIALAEALSEGTLGQALVVRAILNRSALVQQRTKGIGPGHYNSSSASIRDIIYGRDQFQPVDNGTIDAARSASQLNQASEAIKLATDTNALKQAIMQSGKSEAEAIRLINSTGFRAGYAFNDSSQNYDRIQYKGHIFNSDKVASTVNVSEIYSQVWGGISLPGVDNSSGVQGLLNNTAGQAANFLNSLGGLLMSNIIGENCPPPPFTQQDRIIYAGCSTKVQGASQIGGLGAGMAAGSVAANGLGQNIGLAGGPNSIYQTPVKGIYAVPVVGDGKFTVFSLFGPRNGRPHNGVDLSSFGSANLPIVASADGTCQLRVDSDGYGDYIDITHLDGSMTRYAHLAKRTVVSGQTVKQGEQIGLMGGAPGTPGAGSSTGVHLHFEIHINGRPVDPLPYLPPMPGKR